MNKFMNINPGRFAAALGTLCLALALSACGGGGDGGTTVPTPNNPATGTLTASGCTVPDGASSCNASASWTTSNATSPRLTSGGATVSTLPSGSATFSISLGTTSVALTNAGAVLASMNVTAGCGANSTVVSGICQATTPTVLHYTDKVYAIWTAAYPYAVTKTGVNRLVNKTSYSGVLPFMNCWLPEAPLSDGRILLSCQSIATLQRVVSYINPVTDEIYDYTGTVPAGTVWKDTAVYDPAKPEWDAKARVSDGWYFTTSTVSWVLNFKSDATSAVSVVKTVDPTKEEGVRLLMVYNH